MWTGTSAAATDLIGEGRSPLPDTQTLGAMGHGVLLVQELQVRLFVIDDTVDIVFALEAVVHGGQHGVAIGGQVDPDDIGALVGEHVEETGVLVGKPVVVLRGARMVSG